MMRRGCAAAVTVAVVGVAAAGCGSGERSAPAGDGKPAAAVTARPAYSGLSEVPERLGADGTTIVVGDQAAPVAVRLYEDPRCPVCEEFETTGGAPELRKAVIRREARTEYTLASFLDDGLGGSGSKKAVNALRAALEAGKFAEYHDVLYAHQPEESVDGFTDANLLKLAERVPGLRGADFDSAVKTMKYRTFVTNAEKAFDRSGVRGTPAVEINEMLIPSEYSGLLFDGKAFAGLLSRAGSAG
ncbi:DsbA family protein [Streptomyces sp. LP11]|uniref:DsbA family protein n=1 Tax=Streptomyces pyxinicus TaxID=2970331 RepID=A0ABT2B444_9ACTN|nr:DsbA family protein [Streptomyces sp. LP11]MCS0603281.1 DsbA family protein [Streptomyces sp. LP11]